MRRPNRIRRAFYTLATLCSAMAMAGAAEAAPVMLGPEQMDAITAGAAVGSSLAMAIGPFAFTGSSANAVNYMTTLNGNPSLAGYVAGSEAVGSATASGTGSASGTAAMTSAVVPGTQVVIYSLNANQQIGSVSTSGSATMAFGSFTGPQVSF